MRAFARKLYPESRYFRHARRETGSVDVPHLPDANYSLIGLRTFEP